MEVSYIRVECPNCGCQFDEPFYGDHGYVVCPECGHDFFTADHVVPAWMLPQPDFLPSLLKIARFERFYE